MNEAVDIPREKIAELIAKHGDALWQDRNRCEGLLRDHCGSYRREISALSAALHERVPQELRGSWQSAMTPEAMRARLIQRIEDNRGLAPQVAGWAVDAWAHALKVPLGRISDRLDSEVILPGRPHEAAPASTPGSVWIAPTNQPRAAQGSPVVASSEIPSSHKPAAAGAMAIMANPKAKSYGGLGLVALLALGFFFFHKSPASEVQPCANKAADGSCSTGVVTPPVVHDATPKPKVETAPVPVAADVVSPGTTFHVRVNEGLSSDSATVGQFIGGVLMDAVLADGKQISAAGTKAILVVREVGQAGSMTGSSRLGLAVYQIYVHDRPVQIRTNENVTKGPSRTVSTVKKTGIMAAAGCAAGGLVGKIFHKGGKGCAAGAGAGGAGGAGGAIMSAKAEQRPAVIEPETILNFRFVQPLSIPVTAAGGQTADLTKS